VFGARFNPEEVIQRAHLLLGRMEQHLANRTWLAADHPTIADVAVYSYLVAAPEGNVDLSGYPSVLRLLQGIEALPGFVPFPRTAAGLHAAQA
jgi:glutathione S-transferase